MDSVDPGRVVDPFALTCDPAAYVARPACEAALEELRAALAAGRSCALSGPPGIGKTPAPPGARGAARRPLALPLSPPRRPRDPDDLFRLALGLLGAPGPRASDPEAAFLARARRAAEAGRPLVVLLDDAQAMPLPTARHLAAGLREPAWPLWLVAALTDDVRAARVLGALGPELVVCRFASAMTEEETLRYLAERLARAPVDARARLGPGVQRWLHRESGGVPRRIHQLAGCMLHRDDPAPDTLPPLAGDGPALELDPAS